MAQTVASGDAGRGRWMHPPPCVARCRMVDSERARRPDSDQCSGVDAGRRVLVDVLSSCARELRDSKILPVPQGCRGVLARGIRHGPDRTGVLEELDEARETLQGTWNWTLAPNQARTFHIGEAVGTGGCVGSLRRRLCRTRKHEPPHPRWGMIAAAACERTGAHTSYPA